MGLLIVKADFTGKFGVGKTNFDKLDAYIARYEKKHLRKLLGVELYDLFETDVTDNGVNNLTARFDAIYDPIIQDDGDDVIENNGMKQMVLGLVWFDFVREFKIKITHEGAVVNDEEVAQNVDSAFMYQRYNEAVEDWKVIQWYIDDNSSTYPEYNGQELKFAHWAL